MANKNPPLDPIRPYQWKKGHSGNPGGRPKDPFRLTPILKEQLQEEADCCRETRKMAIALGLDPRKSTVGAVLTLTIICNAAKGESPLAKEILNRLEGKVSDQLEVNPGAGMVALLSDEQLTDRLKRMMERKRKEK